MEIVSWNLNGLDEAFVGPRLEAALQDVLLGARLEALAAGAAPRPPPDVVLLQEVTATGLDAVLRPHLAAAGFALFPPTAPARTYFEVCAVRAPWSVRAAHAERLPETQYDRWLHRLELEGPGAPWRVLTGHFDSGPEPATAAIRAAQAKAVAARLGAGPAVFAGDTNLRDAEQAALPDLEAKDAWVEAGRPAAHRFTWLDGRRKARFDRAFVTPDVRVRAFETIGGASVPGYGAPPSDHLGVRLTLSADDAE